jgi:hypothetical protein
MMAIRLFEESVNELYTGAPMPGLAHTHISDLCAALRKHPLQSLLPAKVHYTSGGKWKVPTVMRTTLVAARARPQLIFAGSSFGLKI